MISSLPLFSIYHPGPWLYLLGLGSYVAIIISCIYVVLTENRNPIRSLAWVLSLIFLPGVGLVFYMFFGRSLKGLHLISRRGRKKLLNKAAECRANLSEIHLDSNERTISSLVSSLCNAPLTINNKVEIFTDGASKFNALIADLKNAQKSILLQYYIFSDDKIGNKIANILIEKARSGLAVRVIYDNVGSFSTKRAFFKRMADAGVEIHPFFRVSFPQLANRINWRNHRKLVIIDNSIGYIGGMNIADRYARSESEGIVWRDTHFRLRGNIVESLILSFAVDWFFLNKNVPSIPLDFAADVYDNQLGMQMVTSGPTDIWDNLSLVFLRAISNAQKSIYIQTPYFLPTDALIHALEAAALAGIDVKIMLPGRCDSKLLQYASHSYVTQCLKAGINVYHYTPGMLHSKMMIIDDTLSTVGSTNFDFRSFENNFECNLMVYDKGFNTKCRKIFSADLAHCEKVSIKSWKKRPIITRMIESVVRLMSPVL